MIAVLFLNEKEKLERVYLNKKIAEILKYCLYTCIVGLLLLIYIDI